MGTRQTVATKSDCASQYRDRKGAAAQASIAARRAVRWTGAPPRKPENPPRGRVFGWKDKGAVDVWSGHDIQRSPT